MSSQYILSYTAASLSFYESEIIANLFLETGDWQYIETKVLEENILQKSSISTRARKFRELKRRLETLTSEQLAFYAHATSSDVKNLTMLSCFKLYQFIFDFASTVIRNKLLLFDFQILNSDYESFYESKALSYENLNTVSEGTQYKLKQVIFKMLEQAELIDSAKTKIIQKPYLSEELIKLIINDDAKYLRGFLYSDGEINDAIKRYA